MSGKTEKYWGSGMEKWPFRLGGSLSHKRSKQENKWSLDCQNRCGYCSGGTEGSQMWAPHSRHWGMAVRIDVGAAQEAVDASLSGQAELPRNAIFSWIFEKAGLLGRYFKRNKSGYGQFVIFCHFDHSLVFWLRSSVKVTLSSEILLWKCALATFRYKLLQGVLILLGTMILSF